MLVLRSSLNNSKNNAPPGVSKWRSFVLLFGLFLFYSASYLNAQCVGTPCNLAFLPPQPLAIDIALSSGSGTLTNGTLSSVITPAGSCGYGGAVYDFMVFSTSPTIGDPQEAGARDFDCADVASGMTFTRYIVLEDNNDGTNNVFDLCDAQIVIEVIVTVTDVAPPVITPMGDGPDCLEVVALNTDMDYTYTDAAAAPTAMAPAAVDDCISTMTFTLPAFSDNCGIAQLDVNFSAQVNNPALPANQSFLASAGALPTQLTVPFSSDPATCNATTRVTYVITDPSGATATCYFDVMVTDNEEPVWNSPYDLSGMIGNYTSEINTSNAAGFSTSDWDEAASRSVSIVLDCNKSSYGADINNLENLWLPTASDNCDVTLTATETWDSDTDFAPCQSRIGVDNVSTVHRRYFSVSNGCPNNELGHPTDMPDSPGNGDDERFRLLIFTADPVPPLLNIVGSGVPTPVESGTQVGGFTYTYTGLAVERDLDDPIACAYTIVGDEVTIEGDDCAADADITYSWALNSSVDLNGNPTGLAPASGGGKNIAATIPTFPAGTHNITYTAVDPCGNTSTYTFDLIISDATAPDFGTTCPPAKTAVANTGSCEAQVAWMVPTPTDCSGLASFSAVATAVDDLGMPVGPSIPINTGNLPGGTCVDIFDFTGVYDVANWVAVNSGTGGAVDEFNAPTDVTLSVGDNDVIEYKVGVTDNGVIEFDYSLTTNGGGGFTPRQVDLEYSLDGGANYTLIDSDIPFFATSGTVQLAVSASDQLSLRLTEPVGIVGGTSTISNFSFNCVQGAFADFPVGNSCVTYTATDNAGNTETCKFTVTVEDIEEPTLVAPAADQVLFMDEIDCATPVVPDYTFLENFADNCGYTVTQSPAAGSDLTLVTTLTHNSTFTVTLTATSSGQTVTDEIVVTINDNVDPIVTCPANVTVSADSDVNGNCTAFSGLTAFSLVANTFTDQCNVTSPPALPTVVRSDDATLGYFDPFPLGTTTVTLTYTDAGGNTADCSFTVTVTDDTPPVIDAIADILRGTDADGAGDCDVAVTWTPTVNDNCDGSPTVISSPPSGTIFTVGTNPVVITAIDAAGNSSTETFNVIVSDNENPAIQNCQTNIALETICADAPVPLYFPGATDNCGVASETQSPAAGTALSAVTTWIAPWTGPAVGAQFTITFTATDQSGLTDVCTSIVTLSDSEDPIPSVLPTLADLSSTCGSLIVTAPTAFDCALEIYGIPSNGGVLVVGSSPPEYTFVPLDTDLIIWTYIDAQGHSSQQAQSIVVVDDAIAPGIMCPADVPVNTDAGLCTASFNAGDLEITPGMMGALTVGQYADNCSFGTDPIQYELSGATTVAMTTGNDASSQTFNIGETFVTYTVTDAVGLTNACTFSVVVTDIEKPVLVGVPANVTVECDAIPAPATVTAIDNCPAPGSSVTVTYAQVSTQGTTGCSQNSYTLTRTWTATDNATVPNSTSATQVITVVDTEAPEFDAVLPAIINAANTVGQCNGLVMVNVDATEISDNCDMDVMITNDHTLNGASADGVYPVGTTTVTFTATDNCLNSSTYEVDVIVADEEDPEMVCFNINLPITSNGTASIDYSDVVLPNYGDNCTSNILLEPTFTVTPNTFTCSDIVINPLTGLAIPIPVTITLTDEAMNVATCVSYITLQENVIPDAVCQAFTAQLDANGEVTVVGTDLDGGTMDNCGGSLVYTINGFPSMDYDCNNVGTFMVTMGVTDPAGNTDNCQAMLTIADEVAPMAQCQPVTLMLDANGDAELLATAVDNGSTDACGIASLSVSQTMFDCSHLGPNTVVFSVTDNNNNTSTQSCVVTVVDDLGPEVMCMGQTLSLLPDGTLSIPASDLDNGSTDNCTAATDLVFTNETSTTFDFDCSDIGETVVTLTATDDDNNTATCTTVMTILPAETVEFTAGSEVGPAGSQVDIPITVTDFYVMRSFQFSVHLANGAVATIDDIIPNISGIVYSQTGDTDRVVTWNSQNGIAGLTLPDDAIVFWIRVNLVGSSGQMTDVIINGTPTAANASQGCGPTPYVTDIDLVSPGSVAITAGSSALITGTVTREGTPVALVEVNMTGDVIGTVTTDATGTYSFSVPVGSDVTIKPEKDINVTNGLFAVDGAIIRAHIASGTPLITSPYRLLAADVDLSSSTIVMDPTSADAGIIQNLIAGNFPDFQLWGNDSWRFVPHSHMFPVMSNPWFTPVPNSETITNIGGNEVVDFEGIKNGDVDADANTANLIPGDPIIVTLQNEALVAGQEYTLNFGTKDFTDMVAYQFTLDYDAAKISFVDATEGDLNNTVFGLNQTDQGHMALVWSESMPIELTESQTMFSLTFIANEDVADLEDLFSISNVIAQAVAFRSDFDPVDVVLEVSTSTSTTGVTNQEFALFQNQPNPFKSETSIGFRLPNGGEATLNIYDVSGKLIYTTVGDYARGYNEISLQKADLPQVGLLYYQLESVDGIATRKMLLNE